MATEKLRTGEQLDKREDSMTASSSVVLAAAGMSQSMNKTVLKFSAKGMWAHNFLYVYACIKGVLDLFTII